MALAGDMDRSDKILPQELNIPFVHLVDNYVSNFRQFRVPNKAA